MYRPLQAAILIKISGTYFFVNLIWIGFNLATYSELYVLKNKWNPDVKRCGKVFTAPDPQTMRHWGCVYATDG